MIGQKKLFLWLVIICGYGNVQIVETINILGVVSSPSKSHTLFTAAILKELARDGHSITLLSPFPQSQKVYDIPMNDLGKNQNDRFKGDWTYYYQKNEIEQIINLYTEGLKQTDRVISHPGFQKLLKSHLTFDAIIMDYDYNEALIGLGEYFDCPVILVSTGKINGMLNRYLGLKYPMYNLSFFDSRTFGGVFSFIGEYIKYLIEQLFIDLYYSRQQRIMYEKAFPLATRHFDKQMKYSIEKIFISSIADEGPLVQKKLVDVTGIHIPDKRFFDYSFSNSLDEFINSAEHGCIYVSFGLDINPWDLPKEKMRDIVKVLSRRPEKIIWSWMGNVTRIGNSDNFFVDKAIPQDDVLRHRNVRVFITSGGHLSLVEAAYHEKPVIGIPLSIKSNKELDIIALQGLGIKIDLKNISEISLTWAINEVTENERYYDHLLSKSYEIQDRPMKPIDLVKYWLKYIHRQHRFDNRSKRKQIMLPEFYLLDVYLISSSILVICFFSIVIVCACIYKLTTHISSKKKPKLY